MSDFRYLVSDLNQISTPFLDLYNVWDVRWPQLNRKCLHQELMSYIYLISLEGLQIVKKKTQFDLPYPGTRGCVFTGRDKVNAKILKDSSPVIAPTIASLINNAFLWAVFHFLGKKLKSFQFLNQGTMRNLLDQLRNYLFYLRCAKWQLAVC